MKLTKTNENKLIDGMLELLLPATYMVTSRKFGSTLIDLGVTKDANGNDIDPKILYTTKEPHQVNHKRALKKMIKKMIERRESEREIHEIDEKKSKLKMRKRSEKRDWN